jgi:hypothetical protein
MRRVYGCVPPPEIAFVSRPGGEAPSGEDLVFVDTSLTVRSVERLEGAFLPGRLVSGFVEDSSDSSQAMLDHR